MASLAKAPPTMLTSNVHQVHPRSLKLSESSKMHHLHLFPRRILRHTLLLPDFKKRVRHTPIVCCTKSTLWESTSSSSYAPVSAEDTGKFLPETSIFDTLNSDVAAETSVADTEEITATKSYPLVQLQFLKWPMWLVGPSLLLTTGVAPTLWLPLSSVFLGPNVASLLSLVGLDCLFNIGATLFLLMADSCSRPKDSTQACNSKPPLSYKFWNIVATVSGFVIPLAMLIGSEKGLLQPHLSPISFAVLLGPYILLLFVQFLTELLTWHWQSPVWLVTPVVYEAYRVLQLMRGLKLGADLTAPSWMLHTMRGLTSWWILILGIQLMSVAWFAGFAAQVQQKQQQPSSAAESDG